MLTYNDSKDLIVRFKIGRCWLSIISLRRDILLNSFENLMQFFNDNLSVQSYEMNFTACEFYLFLTEEEGKLLKDERILNRMQSIIKK